MFMISVLKASTCLILVDTQKTQFIMIVQTKKVLGKMKDELNGTKIVEFVGLKSKMYSLINEDDKEINKAKGVNKKLKHNEYLDVLLNKKVVNHSMKRKQSRLHKISTYDLNKISLSCFDDKRYALDDGINTLVYFHKDISYQKH